MLASTITDANRIHSRGRIDLAALLQSDKGKPYATARISSITGGIPANEIWIGILARARVPVPAARAPKF
jgi:hypothetical protein